MPAVSNRIHAALFDLGDDLAGELLRPLGKSCRHIELVRGGHTKDSFEKIARSSAQIIFCAANVEIVSQLRKTNPRAQIVVVTRHPEVAGWLDAIEAGAADYCASPFETPQMNWIVESSMRAAGAAVAA